MNSSGPLSNAPSPRRVSATPVRLRARLVLIASAVGLVAAVGLAALTGTPVIHLFQATANQIVATCRAAGPFAFFTAMALLPLAGFPLAPFTLSAGPVFGPTLGLGAVVLWSFLAVIVNVTLSYWVAAGALRPVVARLLRRLGFSLPCVEHNSAWLLALVVRIVPGPPFFLQSYLLGLARVPFRVYLVVSTLVPFGYIVCVIMLGSALARGDLRAALEATLFMTLIGALIHQVRRRLSPRIRPSAGKSSN